MERRPPTAAAGDRERYRKGSAASAAADRARRDSPPPSRRAKLSSRTIPLLVLAVGAFAAGVAVGVSSPESEAAQRFADAWERQDFEAMHAELSPEAQEAYPLKSFSRLYIKAQATATAIRVLTGKPEGAEASSGDAAAFEATVDTQAFGQVTGRVELALDGKDRIAWQPHLVFPGLVEGEDLDRKTTLAERAPLLAADRTPLAEGPASARTSPLGNSALAIAGALGSPSQKQEREIFAKGFPEGSVAGTSGLELAFNTQLAGQPSGELIAKSGEPGAGERILASGDPTPGKPVRTTIDPELQTAAVSALGDQYGGLAVLDARSGDVRAVAGLAFSAPQPPGSTFKIITAAAALDAGVVELSDEFPVETANSLIGREISNAHDTACGGNLVESFADSCNTVFAPLGVEVGVEKMVGAAERFGFNSPPSLAAEDALEALAPPPSTIPAIDGDVALGESAIGQGQVLATPLQMASVAQTIANDGVREPTSIVRNKDLRPDAEPVEVTSPETATQMEEMMLAVVGSGTGTAAQVPGVKVAGKTGTAELGPAPLAEGQVLSEGEDPPQTENAWFTAYAPAAKPKLAIAVMLIDVQGGGGGVAAPIAREVLASALG